MSPKKLVIDLRPESTRSISEDSAEREIDSKFEEIMSTQSNHQEHRKHHDISALGDAGHIPMAASTPYQNKEGGRTWEERSTSSETDISPSHKKKVTLTEYSSPKNPTSSKVIDTLFSNVSNATCQTQAFKTGRSRSSSSHRKGISSKGEGK